MTVAVSKWLSPAQAARELGVTPSRVRQLMAGGALPYQWTPLGRVVDVAAVESLRAERAQRAGAARCVAEGEHDGD